MGLFGLAEKQLESEATTFVFDQESVDRNNNKVVIDGRPVFVCPTELLSAEEYEEGFGPLTIKPATGQISLTDSEGTEITMSAPRQLDKYGFILNIDAQGSICDTPTTVHSMPSTAAEAQRTERREQKWNTTLTNWERRRQKKLKERLRKGVPDAVRGKVWLTLGGGIREPGLYQEIVQKTSDAMLRKCKEQATQIPPEAVNAIHAIEELSATVTPPTSDVSSRSQQDSPKGSSTSSLPKEGSPSSKRSKAEEEEEDENVDYAFTKAFRTVQDTIERDIHRTFPRHNLFYEEDKRRDDEEVTNAASNLLGLSGTCDPELASIILNLQRDIKTVSTTGATTTPLSTSSFPDPSQLYSPKGQAALRRVLRAYSYYDREVSYCQGMNFIAGMFLTVMSEEEAFWLLISVMHEKPCEMRGMFGEGMRETHKVLYVAENLMHSHLPKLARHFDRENIHVTMFATQWLLTQYTSSFKFDLVTRVWDGFLGEGWKIIYRVMLALLQQWQSQLLRMSFEEILAFFRELPERVDGDAVMETAFRIKLKTRQIVKLEKEWYAKQQQ
mmetsp:Transcript_105717/g.305867  ORF Transcript_105717/g.305867 Transcript_105717/m.305867 type:complete len:556 (+) Transcript_105717:206-1873(+)